MSSPSRPLVVTPNLKTSSPVPPAYESSVLAVPLLMIRNEPLLTAEPSIVVTPEPLLPSNEIEAAPKLANVSLPNVRVAAPEPVTTDITSIEVSLDSSGAVSTRA